jgi:hypothetical protein
MTTTLRTAAQRAPGQARRGFHPGIALAVIAGAQLMVVLDATIVNIALPHIQSALHFSTTGLSWVLNACTRLSWRWVLFVNVPIGILIALAAPLYITESERQPGRFNVAGALTSTAGMTSLVYGFIRAAQRGWSDAVTIAAFVAAVVLLAVFLAIEARTRQPITPPHMFRNRNRAGRAGTMVAPSARTKPQGTPAPWTATIAATWTSAMPRTSSAWSACHTTLRRAETSRWRPCQTMPSWSSHSRPR